jgi:16S rRNA processing protein RimM
LKSSNSFYHSDDVVQSGLVQLGKIIGAHGIHGALRIYSYAESADCFVAHTSLIIQDLSGGWTSYEMVQCRPYKQILRVTLKEITTRSRAESLAGQGVYVPKASLPPLEEDTNYWHDLIGMAVYTTENLYLGCIDHIIPTGANDVYVVKSTTDHSGKEILIPAIASVVIDVDVDNGRMVVALPEGLT